MNSMDKLVNEEPQMTAGRREAKRRQGETTLVWRDIANRD